MFVSDADRLACLALLASTAQRYRWQVFSYCLMDTHWHALIHTPIQNLSHGMQRLNSLYSRTFNVLHRRSGHAIRHRYMSVPVEDGPHLLELSRYLPLNPVRGGLVSHPEDWQWSSHRAQVGMIASPPWLDSRWLADLHGSRHALRQFVAEGMASRPDAPWAPGRDPLSYASSTGGKNGSSAPGLGVRSISSPSATATSP